MGRGSTELIGPHRAASYRTRVLPLPRPPSVSPNVRSTRFAGEAACVSATDLAADSEDDDGSDIGNAADRAEPTVRRATVPSGELDDDAASPSAGSSEPSAHSIERHSR